MAPTPLRFGPMLPPTGPMRWQAWQTAAACWPRAASPGWLASARYFANLASSAVASSAVRMGGKSVVLAIFAPACSLPQSPPALVKTRPGAPAGKLRSVAARISSAVRSRFQRRNSLSAPCVPPFAAVQAMRRFSIFAGRGLRAGVVELAVDVEVPEPRRVARGGDVRPEAGRDRLLRDDDIVERREGIDARLRVRS